MMIRLLKAHPLFFPGTIEPQFSVHSTGNPHAKKLITAGIAEALANQNVTPAQDSTDGCDQSKPSRHWR